MRLGVLFSRIRVEEKLLIEEFERRRLHFDLLDDQKVLFTITDGPSTPWHTNYAVIIDRCINNSRGAVSLRILNDYGVRTVNTALVADICGNKLHTASILGTAGVPQPRVLVAYTPESTLNAIEALGYPVVLKSIISSSGRLLSRINDRDAAEAILEHREILGSFYHGIFYIQEYVQKPGRDIRAYVVGSETICAIYRYADHWITNTARGGKATNCPVTPELNALCERVSKAIGGGIIAVDLFEDAGRGLLVNEVNHIMEFRNSIAPTGVNIPACIVDFYERVAKEGWAAANGWTNARDANRRGPQCTNNERAQDHIPWNSEQGSALRACASPVRSSVGTA